MRVTDLRPEQIANDTPWAELRAVALQLGVTADITERVVGGSTLFGITVERPESVGGWSVPLTEIAIGRSPLAASDAAVRALREMAPRLERKLAEIESPVEEEYVRLHPDDIERIGSLMRMAGHRVRGSHDCFAMNCEGLGPEVENLREQLVAATLEIVALRESAHSAAAAKAIRSRR